MTYMNCDLFGVFPNRISLSNKHKSYLLFAHRFSYIVISFWERIGKATAKITKTINGSFFWFPSPLLPYVCVCNFGNNCKSPCPANIQNWQQHVDCSKLLYIQFVYCWHSVLSCGISSDHQYLHHWWGFCWWNIWSKSLQQTLVYP